MEDDYYKILGVEKTATADEIKRAYKKTAIKYHPDRNPGDKEAEEMFKKAAEAYDVLRDPDKRARYDQFGKAGVDGAGGFGGFGGGGMDLNDIFTNFADIFADSGFGGFAGFGGRGRTRTRRYHGSDLRLKVKLSLKDVTNGVTKKFRVKHDVTCPDCHGTGCDASHSPETCPDCQGSGVIIRTRQTMLGMMQTQDVCPRCKGEGNIITHPCKKCHGDGIVPGEDIVEVNIPSGVQQGMVLTVSGKGNAAKHNGVPGDIQVFIEEEEDKTLIRDGQDLIYNLLLTVPQAVLGDTVEIPTVDSKARIKIQPGTQPGTTLRLRGKGLPAVQGYGAGYGDIIVNISVYIPETLTAEEKEAFEKMKGSTNASAPSSVKDKIFSAFKRYFQ